MARNRWHCIPGVLVFLVLTGCLPIPPRHISLSDAPVSAASSCTLTMVRDRQLILALNTHYISLDGDFIAALDMSEYTTFAVPEGSHALGVTWRVIDEDSIRYRVLAWRDASESVDVNCEPPTSYLFTTSEGYPWYPDESVVIEQVNQFEGEFALDDKAYVSPGAQLSN